MGSLSSLFDLSRNALIADQSALNATAQNVANQNVAGYTRQVVSFQANDSVSLSGTGSVIDSGPTVTTTSVRDRVLEQRVQQQTQLQAETSARAGVVGQIEGVLSLSTSSTSTGSTQIGTDLNSFYSSLTALAGNSTDSATQQGVVSAATTLAGDFNAAAQQLTAVGAGVSGEIASTIPQVNALTQQIAGLNKQIGQLSPNGDGGALEDQRQLAIEKLSGFVGLDQIRTEGNGITLTTQGGSVLVAGAQSFDLTAGSTTAGAVIKDSNGNDVTAGIAGGSLGGLIKAQSVDLPAATNALDALAYQVATAVNTQNAAGRTTTGAAGGAIFSVPATAAGAASAISVVAGATVAPASASEGPSGNTNANALANLAQATNAAGLTPTGALGALVGQVGTDSASLQSDDATQQATLTQLTTQRDSVSAVSLDEEAANLTQYQKSYEAAAKLLTVLDSVMASAINIGVETAVS